MEELPAFLCSSRGSRRADCTYFAAGVDVEVTSPLPSCSAGSSGCSLATSAATASLCEYPAGSRCLPFDPSRVYMPLADPAVTSMNADLFTSDIAERCAEFAQLAGHVQPSAMPLQDTGLVDMNFQSCRHLVSEHVLVPLCARSPRLRRLDISGCVLVTDKVLAAVAAACPLLEDVSVRACPLVTDAGVLSLVESVPTLLHLDISQCEGVTDQSLEAIASHCLSLRSLRAAFCGGVTDRGVSSLANAMSRPAPMPMKAALLLRDLTRGSCIEQLELSGCWKVTRSSLDVLLRQCTRLQRLHLAGMPHVGDAQLALAASASGSSLAEVDVSFCSGITDAGVRDFTLLVGPEGLRKLSLAGCGVTDAGLTALSEGCPSLEELDLHDCPRVVGWSAAAALGGWGQGAGWGGGVSGSLRKLDVRGCPWDHAVSDYLARACPLLEVASGASDRQLAGEMKACGLGLGGVGGQELVPLGVGPSVLGLAHYRLEDDAVSLAEGVREAPSFLLADSEVAMEAPRTPMAMAQPLPPCGDLATLAAHQERLFACQRAALCQDKGMYGCQDQALYSDKSLYECALSKGYRCADMDMSWMEAAANVPMSLASEPRSETCQGFQGPLGLAQAVSSPQPLCKGGGMATSVVPQGLPLLGDGSNHAELGMHAQGVAYVDNSSNNNNNNNWSAQLSGLLLQQMAPKRLDSYAMLPLQLWGAAAC
eukprot:jgi/Mesvir1/16659/Mv10195-RA.1